MPLLPVCPVAIDVLTELGLQEDPIAKATALIAQEIAARMMGRIEIANDVPEPRLTPEDVRRSMGYTGNVCSVCGSMAMVRTGTCETCQGCGATSGGCS